MEKCSRTSQEVADLSNRHLQHLHVAAGQVYNPFHSVLVQIVHPCRLQGHTYADREAVKKKKKKKKRALIIGSTELMNFTPCSQPKLHQYAGESQ